MYQHQREEETPLHQAGAHSRPNEVQSEQEIQKDKWTDEVSGTPWFRLILLSLAVALFSVANPLLSNLASDLQSQHLYASWAMGQGQVAYASFFGTGGLLFYGLLWLSSYLPLGIVWTVVQFLALTFSGAQAYKLAYHLTGQERLAHFVATAFYGFVFLLGFGGLYATIFALPILLYALNALAAHLVTGQKLGFIRYGMVAALALMISPSAAVLFYGFAFIAFTMGNIRRRQLAEGIYQFLSSLVGFSIVFYPIGYAAVWNGSFGNAVGQVTFDLTNVQIWHNYLIQNALVYLLLAFGLGFLRFALAAFTKGYAELKVMALLGFISVLLLAIFTPDFGVYNLLAGLPFVLLLLTFWLQQRMGRGLAEDSRRARHAVPPASKYLSATFYLPFAVAAYLLLSPVVETYILHGGETSERTQIARYIRENSNQSDRIYAWDDTAKLYTASQRLSSSAILSPTLYLTNKENQITLMNGLQQSPAYIVVNNRVAVSADLQSLLEDNYQESDQTFSHFKLYQLK